MKTTRSKLGAAAGVSMLFLLGQHCQALTFTFQENDSPTANTSTTLGTSSMFTESGISITAHGYTTSGNDSSLFAKFTTSLNSGETGLGMVNDSLNNHEIDPSHFIQLDLSNLKNAADIKVWLGSIQSGESGTIYATTTPGSLSGLVTTLTANGSWDVTSLVKAGDFIDVSAGSHNVLITSVTATYPNVVTAPDGGATAILLAAALSGVGLMRRKLALCDLNQSLAAAPIICWQHIWDHRFKALIICAIH